MNILIALGVFALLFCIGVIVGKWIKLSERTMPEEDRKARVIDINKSSVQDDIDWQSIKP